MIRIISWNVNGIRAADRKGFLDWLEETKSDIVCVQETKAHPDNLRKELLSPDGYKTFWAAAERKGYSGVGVFTKINPLSVSYGLGKREFDAEGRLIMLDYGEFILFNIYFPNGGTGNRRVPFKLRFYDCFLEKANKLKAEGKRLVICGDVNTAHQEIDLARPKENEKNTGFLPEERAWITKFIENGYIDTFRYFNREGGHYTWWDYKTKARERNIGWRLDYFFVSDNFIDQVKASRILKDVMGSDHCPIELLLDI